MVKHANAIWKAIARPIPLFAFAVFFATAVVLSTLLCCGEVSSAFLLELPELLPEK